MAKFVGLNNNGIMSSVHANFPEDFRNFVAGPKILEEEDNEQDGLSIATTTADGGEMNDDESCNKKVVNEKDRFPIKLYVLLQKAALNGFDNIISWLPCGTAFKIHDQKKFEDNIMKSFFPGMTRYKSFRRQLNLYGINQRASKQHLSKENNTPGKGGVRGVYSHPLLVRSQPELCSKIQRGYLRCCKSNPLTGTSILANSCLWLQSNPFQEKEEQERDSSNLFPLPLEEESQKTTSSELSTTRRANVPIDTILDIGNISNTHLMPLFDCPYPTQNEINDEIIKTFSYKAASL